MSRCIGRWVRIQVVKAWNAWVRQTLGGGVEARRLQLCLASKAVVRMQQLAEARCFQRWCKVTMSMNTAAQVMRSCAIHWVRKPSR